MLEILVEKPLTIGLSGGLVFAILLMLALQSGRRGLLIASGVVFAVTCLLLLTERLIESPREQLRRTLGEIMAVINAHDLPALLEYVHSDGHSVRADAERYYSVYQIQQVRVTRIWDVVIIDSDDGQINFTVRVVGATRDASMTGDGFVYVQARFRKEGDRWKVITYRYDSPERAIMNKSDGEILPLGVE